MKRKKIFSNEDYRSITSVIGIILISLIPAGLVATLWYLMYHYGIIGAEKDKELIKYHFEVVGVGYFFFCKFAFEKVSEKYERVEEFADENRDKFIAYFKYKNLSERELEETGFKSEEIDELKKEIIVLKSYYKKIRKRIAGWIFVIMGLISMAWLILNFAVQYENVLTGVASIFMQVFFMFFIFRLAFTMHNPIERPHMIIDIPMEWFYDEI